MSVFFQTRLSPLSDTGAYIAPVTKIATNGFSVSNRGEIAAQLQPQCRSKTQPNEHVKTLPSLDLIS